MEPHYVSWGSRMHKRDTKEETDELEVGFDGLSDAAFVRIPQIVGPLVPVSRATWWRYVKAGHAPPPVKLSAGVTAWRVGDLRAWLSREGF